MPLRKSKNAANIYKDKTLAISLGAECWQCPLLEQPVVYSVGSENVIAIVGTTTTMDDIRSNHAFSGPAGVLLDNALETIGYTREEVFVTNSCLCKPRSSTLPQDALTCCLPRLKNELKGKTKIVTMGDVPRLTLMPETKDLKLTELRGSWRKVEDLGEVLVTNHPAFCLHSRPDSFLDIVNDFKKILLGPQRVPKVHYELLDDVETLMGVMAQIPEDTPLVFDLETSNVDNERSTPGERWNSYILSFAFCWEPGKAYVISGALWNTYECLTAMIPFLQRDKGWIGHRVKFDILNVQEDYSRHLGIRPVMHADHDTLLMHYVLDERRGTHGLKILAGLFEDPGYDNILHKYLKNKNQSYSKIPSDVLYLYNAMDVDYTLRLVHLFEEELREKNLYEWPYKKVLMRSLRTLIDAEAVGMFLHRKTLDESKNILEKIVNYYRQSLQSMDSLIQTNDLDIADYPNWWKDLKGIEELVLGMQFYAPPENESFLNPNSPQQVSKVIYGSLGFKTPKGRGIKPGSTNKEALDKLNTKHSHPFTLYLKQYRRFNKLLTTYANKLGNFCDGDDFTHFDFNLAGSVTGRIAAGLLLTIPRAYTPEGKLIRNCFGSPDNCNQLHSWMKPTVSNFWAKQREQLWKHSGADKLWGDGCGLRVIDSDFSQAELRLLGWFAEDEFLYDVYANGRDLHSEVTAKLFGISPDDFMWAEQRMKAKMLNFAMAYSAMTSVNSFAEDTGVPVQEAREIIEAYGMAMPGVTAWKSDIVDQMKTLGWIRSPTGRYRRFPLITKKNEHELMNQAVNFLPQSTSNDATLLAFSKLNEEFKQKNWPIWPVLFMHDGIYFVCLDDKPLIEEASQIITNTMEESAYEVQDLALFPEYENKPRMVFTADIGIKGRWG